MAKKKNKAGAGNPDAGAARNEAGSCANESGRSDNNAGGEAEQKQPKKDRGSGGGGAQKNEKTADGGPLTVVLKLDMHCDACAKKAVKSIKGFEGVESVKAEMTSGRLTVTGRVDPWRVRERVEAKTHKRVDVVSPANFPNKCTAKKPAADKGPKKPDANQKPPVQSTVMLKIQLHCEGCIQRIRKKLLQIKGVEHVAIDVQKELVTVRGIMDPKAPPEVLRTKMKRTVEVVQPKKDDGAGGEKKDKGGNGGGGGGGGGEKKDEKKAAEPASAAAAAAAAAAAQPDLSRMDHYGFYYGGYCYRPDMVHAPQLFSDENPNACIVM